MPDERPATKGDLEELERRLRSDLSSSFGQMQDNLTERMRDIQTEVLRAFHNWASPTDVKIRGHEGRLTLMEERLRQIERGLTQH